ncbi:MAG: tetratricopeptide repeat protein, partial [Terriglobales bacterium]
RPDGYLHSASALANLKRFPEAEAALQRFIALAPGVSLGPSHMGYLYAMQKRWSEALPWFGKALQLNPADTEALAGETAAMDAAGQSSRVPDVILEQLKRNTSAHAAPATLAVINAQLARAYLNQKKLDEAQAALRLSISQDPHNYNTYVLLGILFAKKQSFSEAQQQFLQATSANHNNAGLWTMLGMIDEQIHKPAEAQQSYQRAIALDPNNGVANNNLASLLSSQPQQLEQALLLAQRAKRVLPTVANVNDTLGWIYVEQSVYQMGIPLLQQAVAAQPDASDFRLHLGTALYRAGQKQQARVQLEAAIKLDKTVAGQPSVQQMLVK